jgi:Bacterial dnaA protein helix-turn-helix
MFLAMEVPMLQQAMHALRPRPAVVGELGRKAQILRLLCEQAVAAVFLVSSGELRGASRGRANVAFARQVAMYLTHVAGGLSLTATGDTFGRDRTTVAHACALIENCREDAAFDSALVALEWVIHARSAQLICAALCNSNTAGTDG